MTLRAESARRKRVWIADDDREARALLVRYFERRGFEALALADGTELSDRLGLSGAEREALPDLLITDVRMPGESGLNVLFEIRAKGIDLPVVVVTALATSDVRAFARRLGAWAVLSKPFDLSALGALCGA